LKNARNIIRECQGTGSGADVAASVYGGVVYYQTQPLTAEKIAVKIPLSLYYCGFKTPTVDAIKHVQAQFAPYPQVFKQLCAGIGQCAADGMTLVRRQDFAKLGAVMNIQQGMMESLGVNVPVLQHMTSVLRAQKGVTGAKISGSGLGDCVVALGEINYDLKFDGAYAGIQSIPVEVTLHGVQAEKS
jgi:mevalonate kinase